LNLTQYPYIFTPNFTKYIDIDDSRTKFLIRSTFKNERKIAEIPRELMSAVDEDIKDVMRRFRWIDSRLIHVINHEGIELIVDTADNFKEIEFNFIPLYDNKICKF